VKPGKMSSFKVSHCNGEKAGNCSLFKTALRRVKPYVFIDQLAVIEKLFYKNTNWSPRQPKALHQV
jgi:hypothetical protein